jgi:cell wall-associated NlpC family hydrolase
MRNVIGFFAIILIAGLLSAPVVTQSSQDAAQSNDRWGGIQKTIERYLNRPYVWGAVGLKSFDCSGFVWRIMAENGVMLKRTTARKLYMSLPCEAKNNSYESGSLVFFNNLKHVGIVKDRVSFYHAQVSKGTTISEFNPFWRGKICGFRKISARQ